MPLETGTYISDLNVSNPANTDTVDKADDHLRLIKSTLKNTFPNLNGAVSATDEELSFIAGLTSAVQTQLNTLSTGKQPLDATLTALAGLTGAADKGIYFTGADAVSTFSLSAFARTILDDADAATVRTTLGLGTAALADASLIAATTDIVGQQTMYVPAGATTSRTTNGAASGSSETTTNKVMLVTKDFDASTAEYVQFAAQMPKGWNEGALVAQFIWTHGATTTNFGVSWEIAGAAFANDDASDGLAFGTAGTVTDTGGTTNDIYISDEVSFTVAGTPGPEEWVVFQVNRAPANAADTMAVDAKLIGVKIHYTTDAAKDD